MTKVKLLTDDFMPDWQAGIEVELEGKRLEELLEAEKVELLEPMPVKKAKKSSSKKVIEDEEVEE